MERRSVTRECRGWVHDPFRMRNISNSSIPETVDTVSAKNPAYLNIPSRMTFAAIPAESNIVLRCEADGRASTVSIMKLTNIEVMRSGSSSGFQIA
jgi:hypothetical protein